MLFMIYKGKSYIVSNESKDTFDLIPIVINKENYSFKTYKSKELKNIQRNECKFATLKTFVGKNQYYVSEDELLPKKDTGKDKKNK